MWRHKRRGRLFTTLTLPVSCQEYQNLLSGDASLAEGLYGACTCCGRASCVLLHSVDGRVAPGLRRTGVSGQQLSHRQRLMSLVTLVALPYLRTKAERAYVARTGGEAARLGLVSDGDGDRQDSQARLEVSLPACPAPQVNNASEHRHMERCQDTPLSQ